MILIVKIDVINKALTIRLEAEGFLVDTAITGEEGVEKAKAGDYQIILLDYMLPGIDGAEVCRILKRDNITKSVPILFMSAKAEDELADIIKETGAENLLVCLFKTKRLFCGYKANYKKQ